jgi:fibronectin type 3 domain-containing protein
MITSFTMTFEGYDSVEPIGVKPLGHPTNYFLGDDPDLWVRGARSFSEVLYRGIYDDVDLRFYFNDGMFKYDFVIDAGVDPGCIVLKYDGIEGLATDPGTGDLLITTRAGTLRDVRPVVYQEGPDAAQGLPGDFMLLDGSRCAFLVPDGCSPSLPMVIDPGVIFSTLFGGSDIDFGESLAVDENGSAILMGDSYSIDVPTTPGAYDRSGKGDPDFVDLFVAKFDPSGSDLIFCTYIGGSDHDEARLIEVSSDGYIFGAGYTDSNDFPTVKAIDDELGGERDIYIFKLDHNGSDLLFSTYFGGSRDDYSKQLVFGDDGSIFMFGNTQSHDIPVTQGAYCTTYESNRTDWDLVIVKFDPSLTKIDYCTYLGGSEDDMLNNPCPDMTGNIVVAASTTSLDFPVTPGAYRTSKATDKTESDVVVFVFNMTSYSILYSSYLGWNKPDVAYSLVVGNDGSIFIAGRTNSTDLIVTPGAICATLEGSQSGFLAVMDSTLANLEYLTYIGGNGQDEVTAAAWGPRKEVLYLSVGTNSDDLNTTSGAFDSQFRGTNHDMYIIGINVTDFHVVYSTYFGGSIDDYWTHASKEFRADEDGMLYLAGPTTSRDYPCTEGAYCSTFRGWAMAYLVKLDPRPCPPPERATGLKADGHDGFISLNWERVSTAPIYQGSRLLSLRLSRGTSPNVTRPITDVFWWNDTYMDKDVTNGVRYYYNLSIVTAAGVGVPANADARPLGLPDAPVNLTASTGNRTVELNWSPPIDTGGQVVGYNVYRGETPMDLQLHVSIGNLTEYDDSDVETGMTYYYKVAAYNELGEGGMSITVLIVPKGPPTPPTDLTITPGEGRVDLYWGPPEDDGGSTIIAYRVYRGPDPSAMSRWSNLGPDVLSHIDLEVENGRTYYYGVTAVSSLGESDFGEILPGIPRTYPGRPLNLTAEPGDGRVDLAWDEPLDDGGRAITVYKLYFGNTEGALTFIVEVGNVTSHAHLGLTNGDPYYYEVSAVNEAGEGQRSSWVMVVPQGPPSSTIDFSAGSVAGGVMLSWKPPKDMGGAEEVFYRLYRRLPGGAPLVIQEVSGQLEHLDTTAEAGQTYEYYATAVSLNGIEGEPSAIETIVVRTPPGPVTAFSVDAGVGDVDLAWSAPGSDGHSAIIGYVVLRGTTEMDLNEIASLGIIFGYLDTQLDNGRTYYYRVYAINAIGDGDRGDLRNATPLGLPLPPLLLRSETDGDKVELEWNEPSQASRWPITGYLVLRGSSPDDLKQIADLGNVLTYTDTVTERGKTYYYSVVAKSSLGDGEAADTIKVSTEPAFNIGLLLLLLLVVVIGGGVAYTWSKRRRVQAPEAVEEVLEEAAEEVTPMEVPVIATTRAPEGPPGYVVEEIFIVDRDGRLIAECARDYCRTNDANLMSGMLIAIQGIIQEGLKGEETLESIKYGENLILMASGSHVNLAAVIFGQPDEGLSEEMESTVQNVEASYAGVIEDWKGDFSAVEGIDEIVSPLITRTGHLTREDIEGEAAPRGVFLLSAVDFYRGYVRLKVAAANSTDELISDVTIDIHYNPDMLRLERVEPRTLRLKGDRVTLGNIKPDERTTAAFLFDPQICQGTHIDGHMMYYDSRDEPHHVDMKRRTADVVCPIFFTREMANTAMLRRLIKEELHESDYRVFRYPETLAPREAVRVGKQAVVGGEIQLVREYVVGGPPFEAEVWYYGETKVKGYQIVMRMGVVEDKRSLEFFAASTAMEPITGLLAEFRRELDRVFQEEYSGEMKLEIEQDEMVRTSLEERSKLLDRIPDDEPEEKPSA